VLQFAGVSPSVGRAGESVSAISAYSTLTTPVKIVPLRPAPLSQRWLRRVVLLLLALVLPLQGTASAAFATLGPAHVHEPADVMLRLVDFRRIVPGIRPETVSTPLGHFHESAAPQRHHHARADLSVVFTSDEGALHPFEVDEGRALVASLALIVPWAAASSMWTAADVCGQRAWCPLWAPLTAFAEALERPPKRA
jgi:hypothetical protein